MPPSRTADWLDAAERGDPAALGWHLDEGIDVDARDAHGQTALMVTAHRGHLEAVRLLVARGAALDVAAKYGLTPLMLATIGGHADVVRVLADAGADREPRATGAGFDGRTALALARAAGHTEIVAILGGSLPVTPEQRFFDYALAFEETYGDDDWSRLEPFLADDVVYEVRNTPFDCRLEGRTAVLRGLRRSIDGFDRRCASRRVEVTEPARTEGDTVTVGWAGTYAWPGAPDLRFRGRSSATVRDGRIVALVDEYPDGEGERMAAWMAAHAPDLDASYA